MVCGCDGVEGELETNGARTFCLLKFKIKFKTRNGGIFMFMRITFYIAQWKIKVATNMV